MRTLFIAIILFTSVRAEAGANYWLWYPRTPPGAPYGNHVVMGNNGQWINSDGEFRYARTGTRSAGIISPDNSNRRNGQLAYKAAYDSFREGAALKANKVERLANRGRWIKKITTANQIIMYKDAGGNVALQTPDGKWHITDARGDYAYTKIELPLELEQSAAKEMVAEAKPENAPKSVKKKKGGRSLASISKPVAAPEVKAEKPSGDPVFDNPHLPK